MLVTYGKRRDVQCPAGDIQPHKFAVDDGASHIHSHGYHATTIQNQSRVCDAAKRVNRELRLFRVTVVV